MLVAARIVASLSAWGCSSVGRAVALQAIGQEFESPQLHQSLLRACSSVGQSMRLISAGSLVQIQSGAPDLPVKTGGFFENYTWNQQGSNRIAEFCGAIHSPVLIKLRRAQGECLGVRGRRRTQQAAISHGKPQAGVDPWVSEWGNPAVFIDRHLRMNS